MPARCCHTFLKPACKLLFRSHCRQFYNSSVYLQKKKKVYDFKTIQNLNAWNKDNELIFGPKVDKPVTSESTPNSSGFTPSTRNSTKGTVSLTGAKKTSKTKVAVTKSNPKKLKYDKNNKSKEGEVHIPELSAIPPTSVPDLSIKSSLSSDTPSAEQNFERSLASSSTNTQPTSGNLDQCVIPSPSSFNLVRLFPFMPEESSEPTLSTFKSDVEKLAFRVPPSVKSILSKTMPDLNRFFLNRWREKMIQELGEEGFKQLQQGNLRRGINLHANVLEFLRGHKVSELQIMPENEGHWSSLEPVLREVTGAKALEMDVLHPHLAYRGVLDCVALYRDVLCLIDWKTSKQPRPLLKNTYDDPLQVVAYLGAVNASQQCKTLMGAVNHGVIVVAYSDGSPAHVHWLDRTLCLDYWTQWTDRLANYFHTIHTERSISRQNRGNSVNQESPRSIPSQLD